jgi:hypothetical protein
MWTQNEPTAPNIYRKTRTLIWKFQYTITNSTLMIFVFLFLQIIGNNIILDYFFRLIIYFYDIWEFLYQT